MRVGIETTKLTDPARNGRVVIRQHIWEAHLRPVDSEEASAAPAVYRKGDGAQTGCMRTQTRFLYGAESGGGGSVPG